MVSRLNDHWGRLPDEPVEPVYGPPGENACQITKVSSRAPERPLWRCVAYQAWTVAQTACLLVGALAILWVAGVVFGLGLQFAWTL